MFDEMTVSPSVGIGDIEGVRDGMLGCARGMLGHLREEAEGIADLMDELDLIEVELRLLGARR